MLVVLAAVALAALALATGAGVWWLRLDAAGLEGRDALGELPARLVLEAGVRALAVPSVVLAALATGLLALRSGRTRRPPARAVAAACVLVALVGAVVAVARAALAPTLRPTAVALNDGGGDLAGLRVGDVGGRLYLVALPSADARSALGGAREARLVSVEDDAVADSVELDSVAADGEEARRGEREALVALRRETGPPLPRAVRTRDPATAFAPLVVLHAEDRLPPLGADDFIQSSVLAWWKDKFCDDEFFAIGRDHPAAGRRPLPPIDVARLGGRKPPYRNVPVKSSCDDWGRPPVPSTAHTRAWDTDRAYTGGSKLGIKEGFYLDLQDGYPEAPPLRPGEPPVVDGVAAYWESAPEPIVDGRGLRITYWLLYAGSHPPIDRSLEYDFVREGDWERVSVLLARRGSPDRYEPISVRYHYFDRHHDVPWADVARAGAHGERGASHPLVFSALGSHASYWAPGSYRVRLAHEDSDFYGDTHRPWIVDRASACAQCPRWRTWEELVDARRQPWYRYGGAWGTPNGQSRNTGPLGPSPYMRRGEGTTILYSIGPDPPRREPAPAVELLG